MPSKHTRIELEKLKEYAQILYIRDQLTYEEISQKTGVHEKTIDRWATAGSWKKLQRNFPLIREEQVAYLQDELIKLNASIRKRPEDRQFANSKEADVRRKLVRDIKDLGTGISLADIVTVCKNAVDFTCNYDMTKARQLSDLLDPYVQSLL